MVMETRHPTRQSILNRSRLGLELIHVDVQRGPGIGPGQKFETETALAAGKVSLVWLFGSNCI